MSNFTFLFSLYYLNIFGIFCFGHSQSGIKISRFWKFYCVSKILITFSFQAILYNSIFNAKSVLITKVPHLKGFSNFTIFLLLFTNFSMVYSTTSINILALKKSRSTEMLLNQAIKLYQTLDLDFKIEVRKVLRNLNYLAFVLSILFARLVITVLSRTTFSILLGCVLIPIPITFLCFICIMKGSLLFLEILLKNINKNLATRQNEWSHRDTYGVLTNKYQELYEFSSSINKFFGIQITIVTTALSIVATLNVSVFYFYFVSVHWYYYFSSSDISPASRFHKNA